MIPEAVLLHYLDDAEAKMLAIQEACSRYRKARQHRCTSIVCAHWNARW